MSKLEITKEIFDTIAKLIKTNETVTYRALIYDLLGFTTKDYCTLISGMTITNLLVDYQDLKQKNTRARQLIEELTDDTEDTTCYEITKEYKEILLKMLGESDYE